VGRWRGSEFYVRVGGNNVYRESSAQESLDYSSSLSTPLFIHTYIYIITPTSTLASPFYASQCFFPEKRRVASIEQFQAPSSTIPEESIKRTCTINANQDFPTLSCPSCLPSLFPFLPTTSLFQIQSTSSSTSLFKSSRQSSRERDEKMRML